MGEASRPGVGTIGWVDLTVGNADEIRDFYRVSGPKFMGAQGRYAVVRPAGAAAARFEPAAG